ncbi:MAG: hypothetical protein RH948_09365 [Cyclobacteriaceae bacterium]
MLRREKILTLLVFLFLVHGTYYFLVPEDVHNNESPIKYVKYFLVLLFMGFSLNEKITEKLIFFLLWMPLAFYFNAINNEPDWVNFVGYLLPAYLLFSNETLRKINWSFVVVWVILIASLLGYVEILFLDNHFYMYNASKSDYRVVSIFLNPNNFGIVIAILTFSFILFLESSKYVNAIMFINGIMLVVFSGSKTALGIFVMLTIYNSYRLIRNPKLYKIKRNDVFLLPIIGALLFFLLRLIINFDYSSMRTLEWETLVVRFIDYSEFMGLVENNFLFPWEDAVKNIDNIYLHLWGSFGFPILVLFVAFNIALFILVRSAFAALLSSVFLIIGFTTNFLYLWPLGYFYWAVTSLIFTKPYNDTQRQVEAIEIKHTN